MSRKAKVPISLPKGVEIKKEGNNVTVKGPKGTLTQNVMSFIVLDIQANQVTVSLSEGHENSSNFLGLYWALIANMVKGVCDGFSKDLEMIGVGFKAAVQGTLLDLQLGFSHPVKLPIPQGISVKVEKNTLINITGVDKRVVGQFAADIRAKRPPEPYKGKGIRYKDEHVRRKAGKAGKK
jgi:large subunit ribosomal protein L6